MQHTILQDILDVQDILSQSPNSSPSLLSHSVCCHNPEGKVPWTAQCTCQRAGRKAEPQPPSLFLGTFSFLLGEPRGNLVSPCFFHTFKSIYTPIYLLYGIQKLRKKNWVCRGCWEISQTHAPLFLFHLLFLLILSLNSCSTTQTMFLPLSFWTFSLFWVFLVHEIWFFFSFLACPCLTLGETPPHHIQTLTSATWLCPL